MSLDERRSGIVLDDHPLWLEALVPLLREVGVDVVGRATTSERALALTAEDKPDLFVADLHLKGGVGGVACVREATSGAICRDRFLLRRECTGRRADATRSQARRVRAHVPTERRGALIGLSTAGFSLYTARERLYN